MSTSAEWRTYPVDWQEPRAAVVVGIEQPPDHPAVDFAIAEAARSGRPLSLVTVLPSHELDLGLGSGRPGWAALDAVAEQVARTEPGIEVRTALELGDPVEHLLNRSVTQGMLVVGKRGLGPIGRFLLGSTSLAVAGRARVPVVVVPPAWHAGRHATGPVVVGLDPEVDNEATVAFAQEAADARGVELLVASEPVIDSRSALLEAAASAQLLVLGRRHGGRFGFPPGSLTRDVLHYSALPVAIVPTGPA